MVSVLTSRVASYLYHSYPECHSCIMPELEDSRLVGSSQFYKKTTKKTFFIADNVYKHGFGRTHIFSALPPLRNFTRIQFRASTTAERSTHAMTLLSQAMRCYQLGVLLHIQMRAKPPRCLLRTCHSLYDSLKLYRTA